MSDEKLSLALEMYLGLSQFSRKTKFLDLIVMLESKNQNMKFLQKTKSLKFLNRLKSKYKHLKKFFVKKKFK